MIRGSLLSQFFRGFASSAGLVLAIVGVFSGLLSLLQGPQSAVAFWEIYFDYCRHFSSFCGTPLEIDRPISGELFGLSVFAAAGAAQWNGMSKRRRQLWVFLLVSSSLFWFRALGRSDFGHISGPLHMLHLLGALNALEFLLVFIRSRLVFFSHGSGYAGAVLLFILALNAGGTSNPFRFYHQIRELEADSRTALIADISLNQIVGPDEYLWSVDCGIINYIQERHNPTRHAQAVCISSPNEQRVAFAHLQSRLPKIVLWGWISHDHIHSLTRQYIIADYVLRHFRREEKTSFKYNMHYMDEMHYVVPAEANWNGLENIPSHFEAPQILRRLPHTWAEFRWPKMAHRIKSQFSLAEWHLTSDGENRSENWHLTTSIDPRKVNYYIQVENTPWMVIVTGILFPSGANPPGLGEERSAKSDCLLAKALP
jgi:hypothetical protein